MKSSACHRFKPDIHKQMENKRIKNRFIYNSDQVDLDYLKSKGQQKQEISNRLQDNQKKRRLYENYYTNNIVGYEKQPVSKLNSNKNVDGQKVKQENNHKVNNTFSKKIGNQESDLNEDFKGPSKRYSQMKKQNWMDQQNDQFRKSNQNFSDLIGKPKEYQKREIKGRTVINNGNENWMSVSSKVHVNNDFRTVQKPFVKRQQEMESNMDNHSFKHYDKKQKIFDYDDRRQAHSACKKQQLLTHKGF